MRGRIRSEEPRRRGDEDRKPEGTVRRRALRRGSRSGSRAGYRRARAANPCEVGSDRKSRDGEEMKIESPRELFVVVPCGVGAEAEAEPAIGELVLRIHARSDQIGRAATARK